MLKNQESIGKPSPQPRLDQRAAEIQPYGTVTHALPLELEEVVRLEMTEQLNQLLADSMTLRDLYKKSHWQVAGATFDQLHLLFDKHYNEQVEIVDSIAERIQLLGGLVLPWRQTWLKPRKSTGRLGAVKRLRFSYPDSLTPTESSLARLGR